MITFLPLQPYHFPFLQKWLNTLHLTNTWGEERYWSMEEVSQKYLSYTLGYKEENSLKKPLHAFIISLENVSIGYIQYYDAYDFPRETGPLSHDMGLPSSLAALDFYIGESDFIGKGWSAIILQKFLDLYIWPQFKACFVDPDIHNVVALHTYTRVGFRSIKQLKNKQNVWMILKKDFGILK